MEMQKYEVRVLLRYYWKQNYKASAAAKKCDVEGRTISADVYSQQLKKMYTVLPEKYPALVNRKRVLLQQDNARPHTAKKTLQKI
jgi:hypothetical protein